ncbi:FAD:protein FMN transferase [Mucilaginibacter sp. KACC 22773]|uniref:FAD:protein FMN transferase n=1 Tax=Mucilaginibacter sp. KACC 22773 TaxID=3025671 RepID=UPI002366EB7A|nr:FAD:protein FMN transferase [Mucilaginibacter sp. KACC 22773]WDF75450.1 FAD:protein FMN transferase [Mucilaginibacter sp. KACC 22773]
MKKNLLPGAVFLVLLFCAFGRQVPLRRFELKGYAQGTTYSIVYYATDSLVSLNQTDSLLQWFDRSVSLYQPNSLICRFNRSGKGIRIDETFRMLINHALQISRATGGLVDPTVKPLVDAWGFGVVKATHEPDKEEVESLLRNVGAGKIALKGNFLHKTNPSVQLDLNGIAQGYSVDLLALLLEHHHIHNYLVELGGELRVKGHKADNEPFKVGIEGISGDDLDPAPMRKVIEPGDGAITTSGNYRKHHAAGGKQISHLMNPLTGYPVQNEMISVTVYAKDAITADGYDNGFMAMGLKRTLSFLSKRKDMGAYIVYRRPDGLIADTATTFFNKYQ